LAVQAAAGWSSPWAPLLAAMAARCLGNARGGELISFYRRAQGGGEVDLRTKARESSPGRGMGSGGANDVHGRRPSTATRQLVGRRQGRFARPVDVGRVATGVWVWASVRSRGTGGHSGAPAVVLGRPATRAGEAMRTTSRVGANAWRCCPVEIDLALLEMSKLEILLQRWTKWIIGKL
jgi:hypothetical protein